ncbi:hypothetical protein BN844_5557 [Pseudomonas sp. SHC52]|nr:hypothetical protein BN844_5557 [Pseudomonas sp. SHC52]
MAGQIVRQRNGFQAGKEGKSVQVRQGRQRTVRRANANGREP